jgi:hypothetical protein
MKNATRLIVGLVLLFSLHPATNGQQTRVAAIVEKVSGTVSLKQNGKQSTLNAKTDIARRLFAGDRVHCEAGAKLSLRIGGRSTELDANSGWFEIPKVAPGAPDPRQRAIDAYGRIGGRNRGVVSHSIVYSPTDGGSTTPELFVIRWTPLKSKCVVSFEVQDLNGKKLWRQTKVGGALGVLNSKSARQALVSYRSRSREAELKLRYTDSCGEPDESTFQLLSVANEQKLKTELAQWDNEPNQLIAHLGRASVFIERKIFSQAAEEYEAALALAPESVDLIESTSGAERQTGNTPRAKELEKRLPEENQ